MGNLLTNAFEEVEKNKDRPPIVRLFVFDNGEEIIIEVEDSGNGLAQEKLELLFFRKYFDKRCKIQRLWFTKSYFKYARIERQTGA